MSKTGLLITGYDCALPTLVKHSTAQHDLVKNGYYSVRSSNELKADLDFSEDITAKILEGIPNRKISANDFAEQETGC